MTDYQFSLSALLLFISALFSLGLASFIFTRRRAPGKTSLGLLSLLITEWSLTYGLEIAAPTLAQKVMWGKAQYIGIAFIPFSWLLFSVFYTRQQSARRLDSVHWLGILPFVTVLLAFTNDAHGLIWRETFLKPAQGITVLGVKYGAWFWVHFAISYIFLLSGTWIVLANLRRMSGLYRSQILALAFAVLLPWLGNILYFITPIVFDPTPFAFTITLILLVWAMFGYRLIDIAPIARDLVVENMQEGLLVLDMQGRIVDINAAAARFVGLSPAQVIGKPVAEILKPWAALLERFRDVLEGSEIIEVGSGEAIRKVGVRISPLRDERRNLLGRVVSFWEMEPAARPLGRFQEPLTQPLPTISFAKSPPPAPQENAPVWQAIRNFFLPPPLEQLTESRRINLAWSQIVERAITSIARFTMIFGSISAWSILSSLDISNQLGYAAAIIFFLLGVYFLALVRTAPFNLRVGLFLSLGYAMALAEMFTRGLSGNLIMYFITLVTMAHLLISLRGAFVLLILSIISMFAFEWAVSAYYFVPLESGNAGEAIFQSGSSLVANYLLGYLFSALTLVTIVNQFVLTLNNAWQQEMQTRTLLQQERDLLEQRVRERTADLREARDLALQSRDELRTYYQAIEQSGSSIVITNAQGKIQYVNPKFEQITGYSLDEALGQNPRILKSGKQSPEFYRNLWKTIGDGQVWQGEFQNRRKNGSLYWEFATIAPVKDENGKITHYVAIKEDITAQKELRETLAQQNEYLAALQTITLELLTHRDLQKLLDNILQRARDTLNASLGAIALWENGQLVFRAVTRDRQELYGKTATRETYPLAWEAVQKRRPVVTDNYSEKYGEYQIQTGKTLHAVADFPIISGSQVLGVIALGRSETAQPFTASQIEFGQSLAQIAALVLDNANLYDSALRELEERKRIQAELQVSEQEQRALATLLQTGISDEPLETILFNALDDLLAIRWLGIESKGGIFLADASASVLALAAQRNLSPQICALCASVPFGKCHCGRAALTGQIQFSTHVDDLHEITYQDMPDHGHYNVPILAGGQTLGVLVLYLPPGYVYQQRDVAFLQAFASTLSNIIRRKRTEDLLRESEIRFRQIVENASDIIYRMDEQGRMTYVNPVGLRLMGYQNEGEVLGKHFAEFAVPAWRSRVKSFYKHQLLQNQENTYYEFVAQTKEGNEIWLGQNVRIIRSENRLIGFQAVARDITELKKTQFALAEARDQALEASRFKSQLVSRVSHELRTPLGGVLGYAELLHQGAFGALNAEQQDAASNIVASANYLNLMINELLDQAQIEARAVKIHLAPFQPAVMLQSVHANMTVLALNKGLQFVSEIDPALPIEIIGDERRLQQVLINLAGNAIKFTQQGQVSVSLLRLNDSEWAMRVSDTGAGIPKEAQAYIFDAFRQVDNAITRDNRGTGLGLSITKQLVELMGGHIELESEVGCGSTFTIILPLQIP